MYVRTFSDGCLVQGTLSQNELLCRNRFLLKGMFTSLPPEVQAMIFSYTDLATIEAVGSIDDNFHLLVSRAVTGFVGNLGYGKLKSVSSSFPHLRRVFGVISVNDAEQFEIIISLDLTHFTAEFGEDGITPEVGCSMLSRLTAMEEISLQQRRCHYRSLASTTYVSKLFGISAGILCFSNPGWAKIALSRFQFRGIAVAADFGPFDDLTGLNVSHIDVLRFEMSVATTTLRKILLSFPNVKILEYSGKLEWLFCWNFIDILMFGGRTYPSVQEITLPIPMYKVKDALTIFPSVTKITVLSPHRLSTLNRPLRWFEEQCTPAEMRSDLQRLYLQKLYPGVTFRILLIQ